MSETKKTMVQISRKGLLIWACLVFFVAGWMFVLGILVGRGTAPVNLDADRLQKELAKLKSTMAAKEKAEVQVQAAGEQDGKPELGFYEALKQTKPDKNYKELSPQQTSRPEAKPKPAPSSAPAGAEPAKQREAGKQDTDLPKPAKKIDPASKPTAEPARPQPPGQIAKAEQATGRYTIQVAALKEAEGADRLVDMLRKKGYPAYQIRSGVEGRNAWYRVRVGAFKAREEAAGLLKKLQKEKLKGLIVSN